jgi:hypothetical protein
MKRTCCRKSGDLKIKKNKIKIKIKIKTDNS